MDKLKESERWRKIGAEIGEGLKVGMKESVKLEVRSEKFSNTDVGEVFLNGKLYVSFDEYNQLFDLIAKGAEENLELQETIKKQNKELTRLRRLERRQQKRWNDEQHTPVSNGE